MGELCRYLLATPKSEYDRKHEVKIASGNGMRGEVWDKFKERFGIPTIEEYYRATEVHTSQRTKLIVGEWPGSTTFRADMACGERVKWVIEAFSDTSVSYSTSHDGLIWD